MIYSGRLLVPKRKDDGIHLTPVDAQKQSLKSLSKQEKLLLVELQKTRQNIVNQLGDLDPIMAADNFYEVQETIDSYKQKMVRDLQPVTKKNIGTSKLTTNSLSSSLNKGKASEMKQRMLQSQYISGINKEKQKQITVGNFRSGVDMLPVLATTGESVFEAGIRRQPGIKLPVFKLPYVDQNKLMGKVAELGVGFRFSHDLPQERVSTAPSIAANSNFTSRHSYIRALCSMTKTMSRKEIKFINQYLDITTNDIVSIEDELTRVVSDSDTLNAMCNMPEKKKRKVGGKLTNKQREEIKLAAAISKSAVQALQDKYDALKKTVFVKARMMQDAIDSKQNINDNSSMTTAGITGSSGSSYGNFSHSRSEANLSNTAPGRLGIPLTGFLTPHAMAQSMCLSGGGNKTKTNKTKRGNLNSSSIISSNSKINKFNTSDPLVRGKPSSDKASTMKYQQAWGVESDALRQEFIHSLQSMQDYSTKIKDGILSINEIVNVQDPKAKGLVFSMAADKMTSALNTIIVKEQMRGWQAWRLAIQQARTTERKARYVTFQNLRCISISLRGLYLLAMGKKWLVWVNYAKRETARIKKERELKSCILIQTLMRCYLAKKRVNILKTKNKYQKMYNATILIQKLFRCKVIRWRYVKYMRKVLENKSIRLMQRVVRGYYARKLVKRKVLNLNRNIFATKIQAMVRGRLLRKKLTKMKKESGKRKCVIKIQSVIRGFIARRRVLKLLNLKRRLKSIMTIQTRIRGTIARMRMGRKRKELVELKIYRIKCATQIQKAFRNWRGKMLGKILKMEMQRKARKLYNAATKINNITRQFNARNLIKRKIKDLFTSRCTAARQFKEMFSEDAQQLFYLNDRTQEALWEPPSTGYCNLEDMLVLEDGKIVPDPTKVKKNLNMFGEEVLDDEEDERMKKKLCSECSTRVATRGCDECGDKYCTKCFKSMHLTGSRRTHTYKDLGPKDCAECEDVLSDRWCVSCDEAFCDKCWRKVHSKGKRRFHPYSEITPEGRIDKRIFTMDGAQVDGYDPTNAQQQQDGEGEYQEEYDENAYYDEGGYDEGYTDPVEEQQEEWTSYNDEEGTPYWYNNYTGESTYDDPWAGY
jgi:hypothetical protein